MTRVNKSIIASLNVAPPYLGSPEEQLERSISPKQGGFTLIQLQVHLVCYIVPQLQYYMAFWIVYLLETVFCWHQVCKVKCLSIR